MSASVNVSSVNLGNVNVAKSVGVRIMLSHKSILELPQKNNTKAEFEFEFENLKL